MADQDNGSMVKTVTIHTVSYLVTGILAAVLATVISGTRTEVRLDYFEENIISINETLSQMVEIQKNDSATREWMKATDKTIDSFLIIQRSLLEATRDRYPRKEAREDHKKLEEMIRQSRRQN